MDLDGSRWILGFYWPRFRNHFKQTMSQGWGLMGMLTLECRAREFTKKTWVVTLWIRPLLGFFCVATTNRFQVWGVKSKSYLVGGLVAIFGIFPLLLGISSSQLTNSYFSEGWPWPTNQIQSLLHPSWVYSQLVWSGMSVWERIIHRELKGFFNTTSRGMKQHVSKPSSVLRWPRHAKMTPPIEG